MSDSPYDLAIIGGGINGAGIARDAAGRGLKVLLCEKDDLASATSSASTKLIHGGLRYLEYYEFRLVREALIERERLLALAPHIIWPLQFVLPHDKGQRPAWMIRLGLFLYDNLGGRKKLPRSYGIRFSSHMSGEPLQDSFKKGFVYSDCWVEDARLVSLNALDAKERGADIRTRTACTKASHDNTLWTLTLEDSRNKTSETVQAKALVNAAGPWAGRFLETEASTPRYQDRIRHVKGSHIIVPKLFEHPYAYIFQNPDKRIIFAIPYEHNYTLIGTTDEEYQGDLDQISISKEETSYLCQAASRYFKQSITESDVVWSYAGVRPLYNDGSADASAVTRDYTLDLVDGPDQPPLLNIFGGKLTTYRKLAEHALEKLQAPMGFDKGPWTGTETLPGGDMADADFEAFVTAQKAAYPWLPDALLHRYCRAYGTRLARLIGAAKGLDDLGTLLGDDVYAAELTYLKENEWAETAEDVLWRRSKLGLHCTKPTIAAIETWFSG